MASHQERAKRRVKAKRKLCYDCGQAEPGGYRCCACRMRVNAQRRGAYVKKKGMSRMTSEAFEKIAEGLNEALAIARGDTDWLDSGDH